MIGAIEIGGTKLQVAVADPQHRGQWLATRRTDIRREQGAAGILKSIEHLINELRETYSLTALGVGFGGPVDVQSGRVLLSHQVAGWEQFAFREWVRDRWSLPLAIDNDCNAAALAEAKRGAGQGQRRVLYMTVGTGIGGGFVVDGHIDGQDRPAAVEIGHLRPGLTAVADHDTVESMASGLGIEQTWRRLLETPDDWGGDASDANRLRQPDAPGPLTARQITDLARSGDQRSRYVMDRAQQAIGWALAQATTLLAPEVIVIGGGVSLSGAEFFTHVERWWRQYVFPPLRNSCAIVPAALGEEVVLHGAVELAAEMTNAEPAKTA